MDATGAIRRCLSLAALLAVVGGFGRAARADEPQSKTVAVLDLIARREDAKTAWVSVGLSRLLAGELSKRGGMVVLDPEAVDHLLAELNLRDKGVLAAADASRLARVAAADWAVVGSYEVREGTISADVTVLDAATGRSISSGKARGPLSAVAQVAAALADEVLGGGALSEGVRATPVPVEALVAWSEATLAEQRGDYPKAYVGFARALEVDPGYVRAALDLGRLFSRMGEPEHAAIEWGRIAQTTGDPTAAIDAALLAAAVLSRDLARPKEAAEVVDGVRQRFPLHPDSWSLVKRGVTLRLAAGDRLGALQVLDETRKEAEGLQAEIRARTAGLPSGNRGRILESRVARLAPVFAVQELPWLIKSIATDAILAGDALASLPDGFVSLDPTRPEVPLPATTPDRWIESPSRVLVAPKGFAVAKVVLETRVAAMPKLAVGRDASVLLWVTSRGGSTHDWGKRTRIASPDLVPLRVEASPVRPSRVVEVVVGFDWARMEAGVLHVDLVEAPEDGSLPEDPPGAVRVPIAAAGDVGRLFVDREGRVHALQGVILHREAVGPGVDPGLWIATSVDGGRTFSAARRLAVSSESVDAYPCLAQDRDGSFWLAWTSDRSGSWLRGLYVSRSKDLVQWSYPRRVSPAGERAWTTPSDSYACFGFPTLLPDERGTLHLFTPLSVSAPGAAAGLYETTSVDGETWTRGRPVLAAGSEGRVTGSVVRTGAEAFRLAYRLPKGTTQILASEAGGSWTAGPPPPEGAVASDWSASYRPVLFTSPNGTLHVWEPRTITHNPDSGRMHVVYELRRAGTAGAWSPPLATMVDRPVSDAIALADGTVLTLAGYSVRGGALLWRTEPSK